MTKNEKGAAPASSPHLGLALAVVLAALSGCSSFSSGGPSARAVTRASENRAGAPVYLVDIDMALAEQLAQLPADAGFADSMGSARPVGSIIHAGDTLNVSIWEAPPAVLFNSSPASTRAVSESISALAQGNGSTTARQSNFPGQMVNVDGTIMVPFAGRLPVIGRTTRDVEIEIARRLRGKAHLPQVEVELVRSATTTATVVGEFTNSGVVPLTAKGERVLDAIAQAGGTRQPINKMTIQLTRGTMVQSLPLETIIRNPRQNVVLAPGDVISGYFQPLSFTALGATGANREIMFESTGLTLAEALARAGGLNDDKANPSGAFVFRFEDARAMGIDPANPVRVTAKGPVPVRVDAQGRVAVIYRINLREPSTLFAAQRFPMRDKDLVYVSNAPIVDVQKFVNIISSSLFPIISVDNALSNN